MGEEVTEVEAAGAAVAAGFEGVARREGGGWEEMATGERGKEGEGGGWGAHHRVAKGEAAGVEDVGSATAAAAGAERAAAAKAAAVKTAAEGWATAAAAAAVPGARWEGKEAR